MLCAYAKAQEYKPMLTDGKEWHCTYIVKGADGNYHTDGRWPYTIKVDGDSTINSTIYKKLNYEYTDSVPNGRLKSTCIAAFEKDRKVYQHYSDTDELILDFNLQYGDLVSPTAISTVVFDDYIEVRGNKYRYIRLSDGGVWVEGIGCNALFYTIPEENWGAIEVPYYVGDVMESCYDKGKLLFTFDDFYIETTGISDICHSTNKAAAAYNLAGQPIATPQKGSIFIKGGHKILQR